MSEFKGTRGKWEVDRYNNVTIGYSEIAFLNSATKNHERRYNALLISKAPEMLEMLESYRDKLELSQLEFYNKYGYNVSELHERNVELIKSATQI